MAKEGTCSLRILAAMLFGLCWSCDSNNNTITTDGGNTTSNQDAMVSILESSVAKEDLQNTTDAASRFTGSNLCSTIEEGTANPNGFVDDCSKCKTSTHEELCLTRSSDNKNYCVGYCCGAHTSEIAYCKTADPTLKAECLPATFNGQYPGKDLCYFICETTDADGNTVTYPAPDGKTEADSAWKCTAYFDILTDKYWILK